MEYDNATRVTERPYDETLAQSDQPKGLKALFHCRHFKHREWLSEPVDYLWTYSKYEHMGCKVHLCRRCNKRVRGNVVIINAEQHPRTYPLLEEVAKSLGKWPMVGYGSGFYCELPVAISQVIEASGEEAARAFIARQFGREGCQEAFDSAPWRTM
jgi:hypothetical protein